MVADLAEMMILAAGGYVSTEAKDALDLALDRMPDLGPARYYQGQYLAQTGRPDLAYRVWAEALRSGEIWVFRKEGPVDLRIEPSVFLEKGRPVAPVDTVFVNQATRRNLPAAVAHPAGGE